MIESNVVLGMMRLIAHPELHSPRALAAWITRRIETGLCWFDHADIYGQGKCETLFGEALQAAPELKQQVRLITKADIVRAEQDPSPWKVKHYNTEAQYLLKQLDTSLRRLKVEQIEVFLLHRPDPLMQLDETARALENMIQSGKVKCVGVSNFSPVQWRNLQSNLSSGLHYNQIEFSLAAPQAVLDGTLACMQQDSVQGLAWSPLAGGALFNKSNFELTSAIDEVCTESGLSPLAVCLAWIQRVPGQCRPVLGSFREENFEGIAALAGYTMPRSTWFKLLAAAQGHPVP